MSNPSDPNQPDPDARDPFQKLPQAEPPQAEPGFYPPPEAGAPQAFPPPPSPGQSFQPAPPPPAGYGYGEGTPVVPAGMYYDQASGLTLPNGTTLASVGRRIGAYFLAIPLMIVTLGIGYLIWGLVVWGRGTSPALQVLGMRVWRPTENRPASWGIMALRDIIGRIVDGILSIVTELISFILFLSTKEHRSLHDMVAGTVVLHDPNKVIPK